MSNSWRHHYIPVFYLKGFTDDSRMLHIYDKKKGQVIRRAQPPKSYFYIKNRHTLLNRKGDYDDFMETSLYKAFDDITSNAINALSHKPLDAFNDDLAFLSKIVLFINGLIYRIPKFDDYHNSKIINGEREYLLPVRDKNGNDVSFAFYQRSKELELYRYACRFYCSIKQSVPVPEEARNWTIYALPNDYDNKYYLLAGDSPVLVNDISLFKTGDEIVIAPLTRKHFVIRSKHEIDANKDVLEIAHLINMGIILSSTEYVCSAERTFLEKYIKWAESHSEESILKVLSDCFI